MVILAVVGSKNSGKTTTVELLVEGLTKNGHQVATVKRIHEPDFTIAADLLAAVQHIISTP